MTCNNVSPYTSCNPIEGLQSPFSLLFIALQERINECVPDIVWCDRWRGQEQMEYRPAVSFPAVLIDFPSTNFSAEAHNSLFAVASVSIRLLVSPFSSSATDAPDASRADALGCFELEHKLIDALNGWSPHNELFQPLVLSSLSAENRDPNYLVRNLSFSTAFELDM